MLRLIVTPPLWLSLLLLAGPASSAPRDSVPKLDVEASCREAQDYGASDNKNLAYQGCIQDEKQAREQLVQRWSHFKPTDRQNCVATSAALLPSYVEILTCLEMNENVIGLGKQDHIAPPPAPTSPPATPSATPKEGGI